MIIHNVKKCPFCGHIALSKSKKGAYITYLEKNTSSGGRYCVQCEFCGATGAYGITHNQALVLWNSRD
jgi:transcription elongation factor Elf1